METNMPTTAYVLIRRHNDPRVSYVAVRLVMENYEGHLFWEVQEHTGIGPFHEALTWLFKQNRNLTAFQITDPIVPDKIVSLVRRELIPSDWQSDLLTNLMVSSRVTVLW